MTVLTQPHSDGWLVLFEESQDSNTQFIFTENDDNTVKISILTKTPSLFDEFTQLEEHEMEEDYEQARLAAHSQLRELEIEYSNETVFSDLQHTQHESKEKSHFFSFVINDDKSHPFYKVLKGFVDMRNQ